MAELDVCHVGPGENWIPNMGSRKLTTNKNKSKLELFRFNPQDNNMYKQINSNTSCSEAAKKSEVDDSISTFVEVTC